MEIERDQGSPVQKSLDFVEGLGVFHDPPARKQGDGILVGTWFQSLEKRGREEHWKYL